MKNIHKINETQENLLESRELYRTVVQSLSEGIIMTDMEGQITFVNQRMCDLSGYSEEELMGQKAYELLLVPEEQQLSLIHI